MKKSEALRSKILLKEPLLRLLHIWRFKGQKIVFTNGCFDILHYGHIQLLSKAADLGNKLIVGLNTDQSVKRLKGESRPINNEQERSLLMASLFFVDAVILFEEDTPIELIKAIKPDVLVKGGDYNLNTIVGADLVQQYGGKVEVIPLEQGYSTSGILGN